MLRSNQLIGFGARRVASAPALWTPASLGSALRAWYQADLLTGSNGDPQGTINDSGSNGFNLTAAGSLRATLAAADLNSKNTLRFTAASAQRYALNTTILSGSSVGARYLVYKVVSEAANNGMEHWGNSGSESHWPFSDGNWYDDFGSTVRKTVGNPTVSFTTTYRIISQYSAAGDWKFFIDGGAGGSSGGTTAFFSTGTNTVGWAGGGVYLGANSAPTGLDGWIAEEFYANATTDRQKAEGYLAHKWFGAGASNNLDSTHPYKTTPP